MRRVLIALAARRDADRDPGARPPALGRRDAVRQRSSWSRAWFAIVGDRRSRLSPGGGRACVCRCSAPYAVILAGTVAVGYLDRLPRHGGRRGRRDGGVARRRRPNATGASAAPSETDTRRRRRGSGPVELATGVVRRRRRPRRNGHRDRRRASRGRRPGADLHRVRRRSGRRRRRLPERRLGEHRRRVSSSSDLKGNVGDQQYEIPGGHRPAPLLERDPVVQPVHGPDRRSPSSTSRSVPSATCRGA